MTSILCTQNKEALQRMREVAQEFEGSFFVEKSNIPEPIWNALLEALEIHRIKTETKRIYTSQEVKEMLELA